MANVSGGQTNAPKVTVATQLLPLNNCKAKLWLLPIYSWKIGENHQVLVYGLYGQSKQQNKKQSQTKSLKSQRTLAHNATKIKWTWKQNNKLSHLIKQTNHPASHDQRTNQREPASSYSVKAIVWCQVGVGKVSRGNDNRQTGCNKPDLYKRQKTKILNKLANMSFILCHITTNLQIKIPSTITKPWWH